MRPNTQTHIAAFQRDRWRHKERGWIKTDRQTQTDCTRGRKNRDKHKTTKYLETANGC